MQERNNPWKWVCLALAIALIWFGVTIVRLENQNYAMLLAIGGVDKSCLRPGPVPGGSDPVFLGECLNRKETRTSPFWHLAYGLRLI